jgi:hypothetical protein
VLSDGHELKRTQEAHKRLGITAEDMDGVPRVTERLIRGAGSIENVIQALRGDDSEDSVKFIEKYDAVSVSDRTRLSIEEIFTAADIDARRFIETVTGALMQQSGDITQMMVAVAQPRVTEATIKAATESLPIVVQRGAGSEIVGWTNGDVKAMEIFHKATGFLPAPKGAEITFNFDQRKQSANFGKDSDDEGPCEPPQSMDDFLLELQDVTRERALPAPAPDAVIPVNAPTIEYVDTEV